MTSATNDEEPFDPRPPRSYSMVLPAGWLRLPVRDGADEAITALLATATDGMPRDKATPYRGELRKMLEAQVQAARETGGLDVYLPVTPVGGRPAAASFVVSHIPSDGQLDADSAVGVTAELLADGGHGAEPVVIAGQSGVRTHRVAPAEPGAGRLDRASRHVDYVLPVPGGSGWLVIAFSTAVLLDIDAPVSADGSVRFDDLLVELFDAIVSTLQWRTL